MSDELIDSVNLIEINGIPSFIFVTKQTERLKSLFSLFPLNIISIDVPTWRKMPLPPDLIIPADASLRIEFSFEDTQPSELLWDFYIPAETRWNLKALNSKCKSMNIGIQDKTSKKIIPIPGREQPYIFDWSGLTGIVYYVRRTKDLSGKEWDKSNAYNIIEGMHEEITKCGGYITDMHTHMGLIYRRFGDFDKAKECYMQEIMGARRKDNMFARSAAHGFNNLAVIYKKENQYEKALVNFRFALAIHPNYFEALISMAGVLPNLKQSLAVLGRAYRIRSEDAIWNTIIQNLAEASGRSRQDIYDDIYSIARTTDLATPLFNKDILKQIKFV